MINAKNLAFDLVCLFQAFDWQHVKHVEKKAENDFVTNVDFALQETITELLKAYKDIPVLGEESSKPLFRTCEDFWVIDPLDGTSNFIQGIPLIASTVALVTKGVVTFGLVYDFFAKKSFWAELGHGSFSGSQVLCPENRKSGPKLIGCSTGFLKELCKKGSSQLELTTLEKSNFRVFGSQALQLCYVADGKLDANFSIEAKIWDDIAGALILSEAGCYYDSYTLQNLDAKTCFSHNLDMNSVASSDKQRFLKSMALMRELIK